MPRARVGRCSGTTTALLLSTAAAALVAFFVAATRWRAGTTLDDRLEPETEFQRSLKAIAALSDESYDQRQSSLVCPSYVPGESVAAVESVMQLRLPQCADEVTVSPRIANVDQQAMQALQDCLSNECCNTFTTGTTRIRLLGEREWKPMITLGDGQRFRLNIVSGPASCVTVDQRGSPWRGRVVEVHVVDRHFNVVGSFEGAMRVKLVDVDRTVVVESVEANVDFGVGTAVLNWTPAAGSGGGGEPLAHWSLRVDILVAPSLRTKAFRSSLRRSAVFTLALSQQASFCAERQQNLDVLGNLEEDPHQAAGTATPNQTSVVFLSLPANSTATSLAASDDRITLRCGSEANERPHACLGSVLHDHAANAERILQHLAGTHAIPEGRGNATVLFSPSSATTAKRVTNRGSTGAAVVTRCSRNLCVRVLGGSTGTSAPPVWTVKTWNIPDDVDTFRMKEPWWQHIVGRTAFARFALERKSIVVVPECLSRATECAVEIFGTADAVSTSLQRVVETIRETFDLEHTKCYTWETLLVLLTTLFY